MEWGRPLYFCPVVSSSFYLSFLFSLPNLSRGRLNICHTAAHDVALVWISDAGLKRAAQGSLKIQDAKMTQKIAIWAPSHNFVGLFATEARIDNRKKIVKQQYLLHMSSQSSSERQPNFAALN